MTNDFPGTNLPDLSKFSATDREKQIAAEYSRISIEDTVPILVIGRQSFQLGGLTGLGDDQANWTCWMLAKAIQKIEDAVYDKVEAAIAKDMEDVDPNIVLMEAEARDRERIHVNVSNARFDWLVREAYTETAKSVISQQPVTLGICGSVVTIRCDSPESACEVEAYVSAVSELEGKCS